MARKSEKIRSGRNVLSPGVLRHMLKVIGNLSRTGMDAGNRGDFDGAFLKLEDALSMSRELDKKCLEAKLLNNIGILHTMNGSWEDAMSFYEASLTIVSDHYGTGNFLYRTLQKNIGYLFNLDVSPAA
jgi:tetratricopeptide (TPR) repeat protein